MGLFDFLNPFSSINRRLDSIMADTQQTLARLAAANASLDGIRTDIANLKALIEAGGTPEEVASAVDALASRLADTDAETA